jgi:uncharacterized protein YndB with AHSA1/START domain
MHPELSTPGKLVQTTCLNVPIETAWQLLTDPRELTRWMGEELQRAEVGSAKGGPINFYWRKADIRYMQNGKILFWEPPYQLMYSYWHTLSTLPDLPEHRVTVIFHLTALPANKTMVYMTQTGFPAPLSFEQADRYWRTALRQLQHLHIARP